LAAAASVLVEGDSVAADTVVSSGGQHAKQQCVACTCTTRSTMRATTSMFIRHRSRVGSLVGSGPAARCPLPHTGRRVGQTLGWTRCTALRGAAGAGHDGDDARTHSSAGRAPNTKSVHFHGVHAPVVGFCLLPRFSMQNAARHGLRCRCGARRAHPCVHRLPPRCRIGHWHLRPRLHRAQATGACADSRADSRAAPCSAALRGAAACGLRSPLCAACTPRAAHCLLAAPHAALCLLTPPCAACCLLTAACYDCSVSLVLVVLPFGSQPRASALAAASCASAVARKHARACSLAGMPARHRLVRAFAFA
jgi:hypothetical protein